MRQLRREGDRLQEAGISVQASSIAELPDEEEEEEDLCIVCWESVRETIFYQCMHMVRSSHSDLCCMNLQNLPCCILPA